MPRGRRRRAGSSGSSSSSTTVSGITSVAVAERVVAQCGSAISTDVSSTTSPVRAGSPTRAVRRAARCSWHRGVLFGRERSVTVTSDVCLGRITDRRILVGSRGSRYPNDVDSCTPRPSVGGGGCRWATCVLDGVVAAASCRVSETCVFCDIVRWLGRRPTWSGATTSRWPSSTDRRCSTVTRSWCRAVTSSRSPISTSTRSVRSSSASV